MVVEITEMQLTHLGGVGELWGQFAREDGYEAPEIEAWRTETRLIMEAGIHVGVVAVVGDDEEVVAFTSGVLVRNFAKHRTELHGRVTYVDPGYRNHGVCVNIYEATRDYAVRLGASHVVTHGTPSKHLSPRLGLKFEPYMVMSIAAMGD